MIRPYTLGLYEKSMPGQLPLRDKLREAKRAGYDFLELSIDETDEKLARLDWTRQEISEVNRAQQEEALPICSICLSGHRRFPLGHQDEEIRRTSMDIMKKAVTLAGKLGVRVIQLAGYDVYYEDSTTMTRRLFAESLAAALEYAASESVMLAFETMETDFLNTVEKAMYWVDKMASPYLQVYPDIGNLTNAALSGGKSVAQDLETGRGHLAAMHLKESRPGVFREVPYGEGHVDFAMATKTALDMGVRFYVAEFWFAGGSDWRETLVKNCRCLRNAFEP